MFSSSPTTSKDATKGATLPTLKLDELEKLAIEAALDKSNTIYGAAKLLDITRHSLKRRIVKHCIAWPPRRPMPAAPPEGGPDVH